MASSSSRPVHGGRGRTPSDSVVPRAASAGAAVLGVAGFLLHTAPVYGGGAAAALAAQPATTWVGAGGFALLLGGLLAAASLMRAVRLHRDHAAVFSVLGTLAVVVGLLDPPVGTTAGWALIVITVLAVLQSVLAIVAVLRPEPEAVQDQDVRRPVQQPPAPPAPQTIPAGRVVDTADVAAQGHGQATAAGHAAGINQAHHTAPPWVEQPRHAEPADRPTAPVYVPSASPAATGAQPIAASGAAGPAGAWGVRAQQAGEQRAGGSGHAPEGFTPGRQ
ncbi:DUF5336 domain-containing protein [Mycobacterium sp. CPCC 205372]|uniref:DUF5336 domain-containing protein n=1 Tax=Mycobacterium hippophais TaxID=3016340 RepID=A0ABT4PUD5_9MYCO|nr:DUF5336 domain-containing protein [Mycobacterium hippophais]MCZ8380183.1 DUF5336 domain-containing protein [Mycobacterium hippophais]